MRLPSSAIALGVAFSLCAQVVQAAPLPTSDLGPAYEVGLVRALPQGSGPVRRIPLPTLTGAFHRTRGGTVRAREVQTARLHLAANEFVSDAASNTIWELSYGFVPIGSLTGCNSPEGIKVDSLGNLWAACTGDSTVAMYAPGATAPSLILNDVWCSPSCVSYYDTDVAVDNIGNVYAANFGGEGSSQAAPGNVVFWSAANLSSGATPSGIVADPNIGYEAFFLDTDFLGSVYVDYLPCASCSGALDQVVNPTSLGATVSTVITSGSGQLGFPGGVYTSLGQMQVNVLDQVSGELAEYPIVGGAVQAQTGTLGPAPGCDAVAMGWNQLDSAVTVGEAPTGSACRAQIDIGAAATDSWKQVAGKEFELPIGAAYALSDKFSPALVGEYHTAVMQAFFENLQTIETLIGPSGTPQEALTAMLQLPNVPQSTKDIVSNALALQAPPVLSPACQAALTELQSNFPQSQKADFPQILSYLESQLSYPTSCAGFRQGVESAIAIVNAGESTIYNAGWLKKHEQGAQPAFWLFVLKVLLGDILGGIGGAGVPPHAQVGWIIAGAVAGSIAAVLPTSE